MNIIPSWVAAAASSVPAETPEPTLPTPLIHLQGDDPANTKATSPDRFTVMNGSGSAADTMTELTPGVSHANIGTYFAEGESFLCHAATLFGSAAAKSVTNRLHNGTQDCTLVFRLRPTAIAVNQRLFVTSPLSSGIGIRIDMKADGLNFYVFNGGTRLTLTTDAAALANNVDATGTIRKTADFVELFIDGVLHDSGTITTPSASDSTLELRLNAVSTNCYIGHLPEVLLYDAALDDTQRAEAEAIVGRWSAAA